MFGRKKLKKEIEKLKSKISFLNFQKTPIVETNKYDADVISCVIALGVESAKATKENIDYAKQELVDSICDKLEENIEKYIEFKNINDFDGLFHMSAEIKILKRM